MKYFWAAFLLTFTIPAFAASKAKAENDFVFMAGREYTIEMFRVFKKDKDWFCETENVPLFKAKGDPLRDLEWNKLEAAAKKLEEKPELCKVRVAIVDRRMDTPQEVKGCLTGPFEDLYKKLSERCRNKF